MMRSKPGGLMASLASLASRPDLDTMVAHISPEDARFLMKRGGAGQKSPRTGMPQFWSDGGRDTSSDSDGTNGEGGGRRGGDGGFSDSSRGSMGSEGRGVSNVDATRAAQSTGYGSYRDAMSRGYGLTADALADARGWGTSVADAIGIGGGGYGYNRDPDGMPGFASNAQQNFADTIFGSSPVQASDIGMSSPGLMGAMSQAQRYGSPIAATPRVQQATIQQQGLPRANYPRATNNPFGIMAGDKLRTFASLDDARKYQRDLLSSPRYAGKPIDQAIRTYVGNVDPKAQETYVSNVEKWSGMPRSTVVDPTNAGLMDALQSSIMRQESGGNWGDFY